MDPLACIQLLRTSIQQREYPLAVTMLASYYQWRMNGGEPKDGDRTVADLANRLADALES